jgi:hypothetical protein
LLLALGAAAPARGECGDGGVAWVRGLASPKAVALRAIAATADGGVVAAGHFDGALDVTGASAATPGLRAGKEPAAFVLKLTARGEVAWMRRLVGIDLVPGVAGLAVASDGTIVVGGTYKRPSAALEGAGGAPALPFPGDGVRDRLFLASYGPDGTPRAIRVPAENTGTGVADMQAFALSGDTIAISGEFSQELSIGSGAGRRMLTSRPHGGGTFYAVLGHDGAPIWALRVGADGQAHPGRIGFAADGSLLVTGRFLEDKRKNAPGPHGASFGQRRPIVVRAVGEGDAFAARVGPAGDVAWALPVGGDERNRSEPVPGVIMMPASEDIARVFPTADGDALLVGVSPLPVRFGPGQALPGASYGGTYVARLSPAGKLRTAASLGPFEARAATLLPGGDLLVAGFIDGNVTLPGGGGKPVSLTSAGRSDVVLARHAPDGALRWAGRLGGIGHDTPIDVAADAAGAVTVAARFGRDFAVGQDGCRPVRAGPDEGHETFLVRLAPGAVLDDQVRERRLAAVRAEVAALGKSAARAFKAKRYAAACDDYRKITVAAPDDAAAMADLALCLQRLGKKDEAIAANRRALVLASSDKLSDYGDEATRRHVYYNLGKLGVSVNLPDDSCEALPPAPGCGRSLWACGVSEKSGRTQSTTTTWVRIGISKDEAEIGEDEGVAPEMPSLGRFGYFQSLDSWAFSNHFTSRSPHADLLLGVSCDDEPQYCDESADESIACNVVSADACLGLVGTVCPGAATGKKGRPRDTVDEFYLGPSR